jgi:hypothetical protein
MGQVLDNKMKWFIFGLFGFLFLLSGCSYTVHSTEGHDISTAQLQEIKLGKTTETDLLKILGPPSRRERKPDGTMSFLYVYSQVKNPTVLGGLVFEAISEKKEETFEVILKDEVVQSYHFLKE